LAQKGKKRLQAREREGEKGKKRKKQDFLPATSILPFANVANFPIRRGKRKGEGREGKKGGKIFS